MSKAVILLDEMPTDCFQCKFLNVDTNREQTFCPLCGAVTYGETYQKGKIPRPEICPLREMDVEPVRRGRWDIELDGNGNVIYHCSECGIIMVSGSPLQCNYCPECGARMNRGAR